MSTRLSIISTRTGDQGSTSLGDGTRVSKTALRIHALGDVDELNSFLGALRAETLPSDVDELLSSLQHDLFDLGAELCIPGHKALTEQHVLALDAALQHYNAELGNLSEFILPGGSKAAASAHIVRSVARRAERSVLALHEQEALESAPRLYLNRLSDLMFVLARYLNRSAGQSDVLWLPKRPTQQV